MAERPIMSQYQQLEVGSATSDVRITNTHADEFYKKDSATATYSQEHDKQEHAVDTRFHVHYKHGSAAITHSDKYHKHSPHSHKRHKHHKRSTRSYERHKRHKRGTLSHKHHKHLKRSNHSHEHHKRGNVAATRYYKGHKHGVHSHKHGSAAVTPSHKGHQNSSVAAINSDKYESMRATKHHKNGTCPRKHHKHEGAAAIPSHKRRKHEELFIIEKIPYRGCFFDELCTGTKKDFACDFLENIDGKEATSIDKAGEMLIKHVNKCLERIERCRRKKVQHMYFGKTSIQCRTFKKIIEVPFDRLKEYTWEKKRIRSRWKDHSKSKDGRLNYGKDGMVVLAVISEESLPQCCQGDSRYHQEDYTLALEQRLMHHFMFNKADQRLFNPTVTAGKSDKKKSIAYAVYMAFALEETSNCATTKE